MINAVAALLLALPHLQLSEGASCILASISPRDEERLFQAAVQGNQQGGELIGEVAAPAARTCWGQLDLTRTELEQAVVQTLATIIGRRASAMLLAGGVQASAIDRWFASLDASVRVTVNVQTVTEWSLMQALAADGVDDEKYAANATAINAYLAHLLLNERVARGLPIDAR